MSADRDREALLCISKTGGVEHDARVWSGDRCVTREGRPNAKHDGARTGCQPTRGPIRTIVAGVPISISTAYGDIQPLSDRLRSGELNGGNQVVSDRGGAIALDDVPERRYTQSKYDSEYDDRDHQLDQCEAGRFCPCPAKIPCGPAARVKAHPARTPAYTIRAIAFGFHGSD